uniref:TRIP4/RQT4 C2HC5-type zinc finger domain-containing protein n=2 Tax=Odontella aurita TaxID=265563 RepID=A0A7S4JZ24_9STRA|mmetsp:Transcript_57480/g.171497  ORF Transcript_57480/g.171497 Transcript_57480/m.171497 type:complete len:341 (+) Transcript_57480:96-1118(+)
MSSYAARAALECRLATLLGFDDGASDLFEHIVEIESSEDLSDYLSQLLGDSEDIQDFIGDVGRFKRGEDVNFANVSSGAAGRDASALQPTTDVLGKKCNVSREVEVEVETPQNGAGSARNIDMKKKKKQEQQRGKNQRSEVDARQKTKQEKDRMGQVQEEQDRQVAKHLEKEEKVAMERRAEEIKANVEKQAKIESDKALSQNLIGANPKAPKHGRSKVICGCYGTRHKPLTNCLHCGRIACRQEGYGFCSYCGYEIEKIKVESSGGIKFDKALLHKERLLRYDREFARRTVVLDDQADYFDRESAAWLTEEEQAGAQQRDDDRQREIHERKTPILNVSF